MKSETNRHCPITDADIIWNQTKTGIYNRYITVAVTTVLKHRQSIRKKLPDNIRTTKSFQLYSLSNRFLHEA